jgi:hypothetical protein
MMGLRLTRVGKSITTKLGEFLSIWQYLFFSLGIYVVLGLGNTVLIRWAADVSWNKASWIAYEIATGGDPFNFYNELQPYWLLWIWMLSFHVLSWLLIPILVGTAVNVSIQSWEQRRARLREKLVERVAAVLAEKGGVAAEGSLSLAEQLVSSIERDISDHEHA